jgi:hypothetical protein
VIRLRPDERPWDIVFAPCGPYLLGVFLQADQFRLWQVPSGEERLRIGFHTRVIAQSSPLEISADGNVVVIHYHAINFTDVWLHLEQGRTTPLEVTSLPIFPTGTALALSADGRWLVSLKHNMQLWNLATWPPNEVSRQPMRDGRLAVSPDGRRVAIGRGSEVSVCDPYNGKELARLTLSNFALSLAFSPDGRWLATMTVHPSRVTLWDAATGGQVRVFKAFRTRAESLQFSPDSRFLTAAADGTIRLWEVETGRERSAINWQIGRIRRVCFARDGMTAAALGEGEIVIWDLDDE